MRILPAILVLAVAAISCGAHRLAAETDAACCRCGSFYKLSDEGFGFLRHHVGFCPKCTAEMGGNPEAYLERLRGRQRGLLDAAALTVRRMGEATTARDQARDSIYGRKGSATKFFTSFGSLAAEGASGGLKNVFKGVKKGLGWYNKAADTAQGDLGWVLSEGKSWVEGKTVGAAKDKALLKTAAAMGRKYYQDTGDARGASQKFLSAHGDLKSGVSLLESAIDFYEKTDALANGIQDYLEHRSDALRLEKEWNDLTDQAQALQDEMDKLAHCLELQKQQAKGSARFELPVGPHRTRWTGEAWRVRFASATPADTERARIHAMVHPPDEPDAAALESALTALKRLRTELQEFIHQLETETLPPLLPFWYDLQPELGHDFGQALLEWAAPATEKAARQYDRVIRYGQGISDDVKRAAPHGETL